MKKSRFLLLAFIFFGCATYGNQAITDQNKISQIQRGVTTKEQVRALIGDPMGVTFTENDDEVWSYLLTKTQVRAAGFIPIVGIFAGGADTQTHTLTIKYDKNGIVKAYGSGKMIGGAGSVFD